MKALVGYTGFVGSNLHRAGGFDRCYNSKNIEEAFGSKPDVLYFCGIGAEKFLANSDPDADYRVVETAMRNIERIAPKFLVLISTVDVYKIPSGVDEQTPIDAGDLQPYGRNRYLLEQFAEAQYPDRLIARLPGLYGDNLKKNFIFDMIHFLPSLLTERKLAELGGNDLSNYYLPRNDGFYALCELNSEERTALRAFFEEAGFSALSFTDSRAVFQFYNLHNLFAQLERAREEGIRLLNVTAAPCGAAELYSHIFGDEFVNEISDAPPHYDMKSRHAGLFDGADGYFFDKQFVLDDVRRFVRSEMKRLGGSRS